MFDALDPGIDGTPDRPRRIGRIQPVVAGPSRGVRDTGGNLQNARILDALKQLLAEHVRIQQIFVDCHAVEVLR